jgi:hypothetical protein
MAWSVDFHGVDTLTANCAAACLISLKKNLNTRPDPAILSGQIPPRQDSPPALKTYPIDFHQHFFR